MEFRILELFSGIGGMHYAFKYSQLPGSVISAIDINTVANNVYAHNHKHTPILNNNIQRLNTQIIRKLNVNMLLMSPPCQPHTRLGHQRDIADSRSDALQHLCELLPECDGVQFVLMENVKGFEISQARHNFIQSLEQAGFYWREFILSPTQFGIPNTRHRYYCLARKINDFSFHRDNIWFEMPIKSDQNGIELQQLLETETSIPAELYLTEKVLNKRVWLLDIVTSNANSTMCFTKSYTHYSEGTGSIFSSLVAEEIKKLFTLVKELELEESNEHSQAQRLELLKRMRLRYFTPREVARLMSFPDTFEFPDNTTNRQKYRLLGNSINVCVVGELIKLLCSS